MMERYSLVLEGGGMRGAYTAGALAWLNNHKITFDYSVGISSGAVYLVSFLLENQELPYNMSTKYVTDPEVVGLKAFLKEGHLVAYKHIFEDYLIGKEQLSMVPLKILNPNMEIGIYDLSEGKTVFVGPQEMDDECRILLASCALPIASARVTVNGKQYLDGGITVMVPIERSIEKGNTRHLVITTKPEGYVRKPANWIMRAMMSWFYRDYPQEVADYKIRHLNYEKQMNLIAGLIEKKEALMIRPSKTIKVSRFHGDPQDLKDLYMLGYQDMEARKEEILAFLGRTHD